MVSKESSSDSVYADDSSESQDEIDQKIENVVKSISSDSSTTNSSKNNAKFLTIKSRPVLNIDTRK